MIRLGLSLSILLLSMCSLAQRGFRGGLLLGGVTSQISGDGLGGWDKFGFTGGAWVNVPLGEKSGISMAMKYINKGSRTDQDTITFQTFGYYLNYIDVPVLFNYQLSKKERSSFDIMIGPYIGYLFNQKIKANGADQDVGVPFERYDIGAEIGGAYWFSESFYSQLLITTSILPTRPNPSQVNPLSYYEKGNYNQTIQLIFGIRIGGGSKEEI